jgi:exopolysaccharide biosynthesis protein
MEWHRAAPGVEWGEARLSGTGEARRIRLIVARIDPALVRFRLDTAFTANLERPAWTVERATGEALVAINAGQFPRTLPWGWVVLDGREYQRPGVGPLSAGISFDSAGAVRWIAGDSLRTVQRPVAAEAAFQSYPRLLAGGAVPLALQAESRGVDVRHRDARAAFGQTHDGKVLLAITRFDGAGGLLDFVPFGLTAPEMAAIMGGLGARDAVLLDGGISSQLLVREAGRVRVWRGLRAVPLGLVVVAR